MPKENMLPKIDPEYKLSLKEFHAPRALMRRKGGDQNAEREFEGLSPEARREAIKTATFKEGDVMRSILLSMLDRIEGVRSPEHQKLLDKLMSQREKAALLWLKKFPLKDMLSKDDLMAGAEKVLNGFSGEVLNGVLRHCPDPVIRIVPRRIKAPALLREMDKKKTIPNQRDGKVWAPELWDDVESDSLKLGITNRTALPFDPTIYYSNYTPDTPEEELELRTNEEMVAEYKHRFAADNLDLMPRYGYLPNMAGNLAEGKVLDAETWTAFERPQDASWLPRASWFNAHVVLNVVSPDNSNRNLRCLPWAEGEM